MKSNIETGKYGEELAVKYLKRRFWHILSRNYRVHSGEIDIIGYRFGVLVFFEVKTRSNEKYGRGKDSVGAQKLARIKSAGDMFLKSYASGGRVPVFYPFGIEKKKAVRKQRTDVIEVCLENGKYKINHILNWGSAL